MSDNLTVTIGADSSKLRAELALVNAATKAAQKELQALAAAFNKTGQGADRMKLDAKARQLDQYKRSAAELTRQIAAMSPTFASVGRSAEGAASGLREFVEAGRGLGRTFREFSSLTRGIESFGGIFGKLAGGFGGGLAGLAIGKAFGALREQIDGVSKSLGELKKAAGDIGIKPIQLQAAREVAKGIGQDADAATRIMKGLGAEIEEVRKQSTQQVGPLGRGPQATVLRGGALGGGGPGMIQPSAVVPGASTILRAGAVQTDFSKFLKALNVDMKNVPVDKLGELQLKLLGLQRFMEVSKTWDATALNLTAKAIGSTADELQKLAPALIADVQRQIAELQKSSRGATDELIKQDEELIASKNKLAKSYEEALNSLANTLRPMQIKVNKLVAEFFDESAFSANLRDFLSKWSRFSDQLSQTWSDTMGSLSKAWNNFADGVGSTIKTISGWLSSIGQSISSAAQGARDLTSKVTGGVGMAAGGLIRGAGTGTSDSILARLSNGEFVMSAGAVRRLGSDFLASLNNPGFALGGLVPRFAEGGLATAGGGTPVHLHLGGNSFALTGSTSVVDALVVEANRQQMRSAGTKPSWYAGKPGSR